jgi:hypothetical protein
MEILGRNDIEGATMRLKEARHKLSLFKLPTDYPPFVLGLARLGEWHDQHGNLTDAKNYFAWAHELASLRPTLHAENIARYSANESRMSEVSRFKE